MMSDERDSAIPAGAGPDSTVWSAKRDANSSADPAHPRHSLGRQSRFRIDSVLGSGGGGIVFRAQDLEEGRLVALKVLSAADDAGGVRDKRFFREIDLIAGLRHRNIVTTYGAIKVGDDICLAMELVEGETLSRMVARKGPLPVADACLYAIQAAMGLQHAHERKIIHRDIKPSNVMIAVDGLIKILDFGVAKRLEGFDLQTALTQTGELIGTPEFMAPEQIQSPNDVDARTDVYSLGLTLYFLLTGQTPFVGETALQKIAAKLRRNAIPVSQVRKDIPASLSRILDRMTAHRTIDRYQRPLDAAEALAPFITDIDRGDPLFDQALESLEALRLCRSDGKAGDCTVQPAREMRAGRKSLPYLWGIALLVILGASGVLYSLSDAGRQWFHSIWPASMEANVKDDAADPPSDEPVSEAGRAQSSDKGGSALLKTGELKAPSQAPAGSQLKVAAFEGHSQAVYGAAFSPDGRYVYSASTDRTIRVWSVEDGKEVRRLESSGLSPFSLALARHGKALAVGGGDGGFLLWDLSENGTPTPLAYTVDKGKAVPVSFSRDGQWLASRAAKADVQLWTMAERKADKWRLLLTPAR
jgi:serine/threonine protein kinase